MEYGSCVEYLSGGLGLEWPINTSLKLGRGMEVVGEMLIPCSERSRRVWGLGFGVSEGNKWYQVASEGLYGLPA